MDGAETACWVLANISQIITGNNDTCFLFYICYLFYDCPYASGLQEGLYALYTAWKRQFSGKVQCSKKLLAGHDQLVIHWKRGKTSLTGIPRLMP